MIGLLPRIVTAFRVQYHSLYRLSTMAAPEGIRSVKEVDIDPDGVFKYILIRVYAGKNKTGESRVIVRGYKHCPYHVLRTRVGSTTVPNWNGEVFLALSLEDRMQKHPTLEVWSLRRGCLHSRGETAEDLVEGCGHPVVATLLILAQ
ncbi:UNVERIFIED_CONTAM: hypothetical protein PYX00_003842 [Menopon gallinae]|uniref:C2 domain-containing protein n=1 Tax=Menopon gallinae TaxID=328185 RepID=A0AAW2I2U4_9NEOP